MTLVLGLESSCDETAVAVVEDGLAVRGERVASQIDLHARFGGVIPEVASRSHLEALFPLVEDTLAEAGATFADLDAIAVTTTPGLVGCLLVGLSAAKGLALATGLPIVPVNHVHAHVYGALMDPAVGSPPRAAQAWVEPGRPLAALVVSGGHTSLYASHGPTRHERVGRTIDDAAGEAFDKVARYLGLGYPGGPIIDRLATEGDRDAIRFPRGMIDEGLDFSFSGMKTSVINYVRRHPEADNADLAAGFQEAVVDVLVTKTLRAARKVGARSVAIGGGVAANSRLRERFAEEAERAGIDHLVPSRAFCTDNAAMIAAAAHWRLQVDGPTPLDGGAHPTLQLTGRR